MPTNSVKNEIFLMFERSVIPKIEIEEKKPPKNLACVVTSGINGISALETAIKLGKDWNTKIQIFSWVRYYNDVIHILNGAIAAENLLVQQIKENFKLEDITPVMSPKPITLQKKITELAEKQGRSVDLFLNFLSEGNYELLFIPVPLFARDYDEEYMKETLGSDIEIILRKTTRSLPICLVPKKTSGDNNTVIVLVRPDVIAPITSRILQFFDDNTKVILLAVLDPKIVDLFYLMRSNEENPDESPSKEDIENQMKEKLRGFTEQVIATIRSRVKSVEIEIISGSSLGLSTASIVESHNAANVLVYSHSTEEDFLDPEVDIITRLVPQTRIFIVWN